MEPDRRASTPGGTSRADTVGHGRYQLGELLGSGGFGQVHRALDRLTGETVAVKLVPALSPAEVARSRRELAALRWLRLPGVVRLRDDGVDGATWFMVMDLVEGRPFGGGAPPHGWFGPALELLEVLARVHLAGVLHLDLKPANVLVTPAGRVVVLDFGVARGRAVPLSGSARIEGTPAYMAPEQARGGPCDPRTDLYAVGRMLAPLLRELPAAADEVVRAMLSDDPVDRPSSALEAYQALAGRSPFPQALHRTTPWARRELRALFGGPDRFTHTASDAARLLWDRSHGGPERVRETVQRWLLAGLVTWDGEVLVADRLGVERLRGGVDPDLVSGVSGAVLGTAIRSARRLRRLGRLDAAAALLDAVAPLVPTLPSTEQTRIRQGVLVERVLTALNMERPDAAELALYALDRAGAGHEQLLLGTLVRLARAVLRGDSTGAGALAAELPELQEPELELWRQGYRVQAARLHAASAEAAVLDELSGRWAAKRHHRAKLTGWLGNHLYRLGRYRDAALAHQRAATGKAGADRLASTMSAASAWLEALELDEAATWADRAMRQARRLCHPTFEARATWLVRTVAYRTGSPLPPDPELVTEAAALKPYLGALFAATDAATHLRRGEREPCAALARQAAHWFAAAGMGPAALLARALAAWSAPAGPDRAALAALAEEARGCPVPDLELQVLAFARWAHPEPPADWLERARAAAQSRPPEQHAIRLDVLSVAESLADRPPPPSPDEGQPVRRRRSRSST